MDAEDAEDASVASASSTWVKGQFQANSHWSLEDDASAVSAFPAWVVSSWVPWVDEMQGDDSLSPLLFLEAIVQCRDLWKWRELGQGSS